MGFDTIEINLVICFILIYMLQNLHNFLQKFFFIILYSLCNFVLFEPYMWKVMFIPTSYFLWGGRSFFQENSLISIVSKPIRFVVKLFLQLKMQSKNFGQKNFRSKKCFGQNSFWSKNFWVNNFFWPLIFYGQQFFGVKKNFGSKNILGSKRSFGSKNIQGQNILGYKNFWVKKNFG